MKGRSRRFQYKADKPEDDEDSDEKDHKGDSDDDDPEKKKAAETGTSAETNQRKTPWYKNLREKYQKCNYQLRNCCPHFPLCCDLPYKSSLQFLVIADMFVCFIFFSIWTYIYMYDPFVARQVNDTTVIRAKSTTPPSEFASVQDDGYQFHESTTLVGAQLFDYENIDEAAESLRYSKLAYETRLLQQEVEIGCGRQYYVQHLLGQRLILTQELFYEILNLSYLVEFLYLFSAVSVLVTTCCFLHYTSAKVYLIIIWHMELLPVFLRIWTLIATQSQRLCIVQFGLSKTFGGLTFLFWLQFIPMITIRPYKVLVFTYYIKSSFTIAGNIHYQARIQQLTLREYVNRQERILRMNRDRDKSPSEDDENETIM